MGSVVAPIAGILLCPLNWAIANKDFRSFAMSTISGPRSTRIIVGWPILVQTLSRAWTR